MQSSVIRGQADTPRRRRRSPWVRRGLLWFAFDLLAPTALIYVLLWLGSGLYIALLASAAVSAISALVSYRHGEYPMAKVGSSDQIIRFAQVIIVTALVGLSAWGLLGLLERATTRARAIWTVIAVIVLMLSLLGPLGSGVSASSKVVLACMHIGAAAPIIPLMRRSAAVRR